MVIRKELEVDPHPESNNKPNPIMYRIDGGRIICTPLYGRFQLIDEEGRIVGGGHLDPTEQKLLDLLVKNQGNIVNHLTIKNEIWADFYTDNIIRKYVQRLRRKLEPDIEDPRHNSIIQNEHGLGYKLAVSVDVTAPITNQAT